MNILEQAAVAAAVAGVPKDHFFRLIQSKQVDDWTFVIQCNAMLEGALNRYIVSKIANGNDAMADVIAKMPLGGQTGKLKIARALGASKRFETMATALSGLRNDLAHDLRTVDFSFADWARKPRGQGTTFEKEARNLVRPLPMLAKVNGMTMLEHFESGHPQSVVMMATLFWIVKLYNDEAVADDYEMTTEEFATFMF